jgi:hypothetical protein
MKIEMRAIGDTSVPDCSGRITLGIDNSGEGEWVSMSTSVINSGGRLKLLNVTKKIYEILAITKLLTVFDTSDDEMAALAGFKYLRRCCAGRMAPDRRRN